jgi:hypothetical protein
MGWSGLDWFGLGQEPVVGFCENSNEPSGSTEHWEVFEQLHNWQLHKKGSALWS